MAQATVDAVLHLQDFGLARLDEDRAIVGFAQKAEARLLINQSVTSQGAEIHRSWSRFLRK